MKILSENLRVRYRDVNREGRLKAVSWFGFMQEIAADHAESLGFGYTGMTELKVFWVLARMRIKILRQPHVEENLKLETWPGSFRRLFAARHFRFTDAAGETFIFETDGGVFRMTEKGAVMLVGVAYPKEEAAAKRQERADLLAEDKKKQEQSLADYKMTRAALMRAFEKLKSAKRKY